MITTSKISETTTVEPTQAPVIVHKDRNCACTPTNIWLDVVVLIDSSNSMTQNGLEQVNKQAQNNFYVLYIAILMLIFQKINTVNFFKGEIISRGTVERPDIEYNLGTVNQIGNCLLFGKSSHSCGVEFVQECQRSARWHLENSVFGRLGCQYPGVSIFLTIAFAESLQLSI